MLCKRKYSKLCLILALLLCASTVISCGDSENETDTVVTTATASESTDAGDARVSIDDELPDKDFGGETLTILAYYAGKTPDVPLFAPEEASGDVVDDAIYERNVRIEDRFNCVIEEFDPGLADWSEHTNFIKTSVMAGEDEYDITYNHIIGGPNISLDGVFMNLYDLEYLDFTKPWWSQQMIDEMTLRNQIYLVGDVIGLDALQSAKVLYCNKEKFSDYNLDLPYQDVIDMTWTMDNFISLVKDVYEDVNGNTERDNEDFYGYISHASQNGWLVSCDVPVLEKDPEETLVIAVNGEKVASLVEKVYKLYYESEGSLIISGSDPVSGLSETDWQAELFAEGHGLMAFSLIRHASTTFRQSNVEYGIVPFPLWDENQESYRTFTGGNLIGIPVTVSDTEMVSILFEALVAESYKTVVPAYFETALKEKFTFDSESGQMLDIINNCLTISFAYAYDNWKGFGHMMGAIMAGSNPSPDYASFYASRISSAEERLKLITDFYEANE